MNVPDVCVSLASRMQNELDVFFGGDPVAYTDLFPEAETTAFIQEPINRLAQALSAPESALSDNIGPMEQGAFLSALQKAHNLCYRSRVQKWATAYDNVDRVSKTDGTLRKQLASIGFRVDDELIEGLA